MAGQSIGDRIVAAQHTIIGSDMSKSICKATTSEVMGPKKKHLDYLNSLTNESNVDIPEFADLLIDRSKQPKWVTVFKTLITTHHLMCYGNERFLQHLASRNSLFQMSQFLDRTGVQGYDMSTYIRRYAKYINEKAVSYRIVAYDFTRAKRGKDEGVVRSLDSDQLLKTLPIIQKQLDALLEFDASSNELMNGVINAAFMLIFKDLIRLFACYNDGIINLLEKFFEMKKNQCKDALELYKKFLTRMNKVSELLKVAEQVGIDKGDIPDLTKAPNSLLNALEQHLASLEGKKICSRSVVDSVDRLEEFGSIQAENKDQLGALKEEEKRLQAFKQHQQQELIEKQNLPTLQVEPLAFFEEEIKKSNDNGALKEEEKRLQAFKQHQQQELIEKQNLPTLQVEPLAFFEEEIKKSNDNIFSDFTPLSTTLDTVVNPSTNNILKSSSVQMSNIPFPSTPGMLAATSQHFSTSNNIVPLPSYSNFESSLVNAMPDTSSSESRGNQQFQQRTQVILTGNSFAQSFPSQAVNPSSQYGILPQHQMGTNFLSSSMQQQQTLSSYQTPRQPTQTTSFNPNNPFGPLI